ncbi:hypothetical protein AUEXF2481DRAFT_26917 [Aureobasidium subglaciale EXF-2481]|uniref:BTB domain-containing protein n=1 Tax=Aureobasidium subglaciale (strain EXF-2481) TaxID=1043005 RepID=A0A074YLH2_AURSE|nr:uncharacterized protein AUEXF2481DRAFT_26917 [Aureobasidium subglaciale EXF-2481]KAI5198878.1 hypothetical protein E4T38_07332 [Aureobasidium subglaciale]KAI5217676.1 hypothetical protein E4T40_07343 [Aureobasidium subglaciale]KAI5221234.1 hypothetical protein E4T41_07184 [Aureobasidium subglaciale]KAI5258929.1 hypothetical protein E4T46_07161 [Aureobasidium subglaciale]KEQ98550.1 hypothetical protein AUEXF2481DRAFT_26917 [Aureobasidium subglaciale EXF-2481]
MADPPGHKDRGHTNDVFDNPLDSDVTIKFGDNQVFAHRAILRLWSPYFNRAFQSKFSVSYPSNPSWPGLNIHQVAHNGVYEFDDDDDSEAVYAMLRHMYNMPYGEHPHNRIPTGIHLYHCIRTFMIADQYDCPPLREVAKAHFYNEALRLLHGASLNAFIHCMSQMCGPDAPRLADQSLRDKILSLCMKHYGRLAEEDVFKAELKAGTLFDGDAAVQILAKVNLRSTQEDDEIPPGSLMAALRAADLRAADLRAASESHSVRDAGQLGWLG